MLSSHIASHSWPLIYLIPTVLCVQHSPTYTHHYVVYLHCFALLTTDFSPSYRGSFSSIPHALCSITLSTHTASHSWPLIYLLPTVVCVQHSPSSTLYYVVYPHCFTLLTTDSSLSFNGLCQEFPPLSSIMLSTHIASQSRPLIYLLPTVVCVQNSSCYTLHYFVYPHCYKLLTTDLYPSYHGLSLLFFTLYAPLCCLPTLFHAPDHWFISFLLWFVSSIPHSLCSITLSTHIASRSWSRIYLLPTVVCVQHIPRIVLSTLIA